jgi:hypothetical protein
MHVKTIINGITLACLHRQMLTTCMHRVTTLDDTNTPLTHCSHYTTSNQTPFGLQFITVCNSSRADGCTITQKYLFEKLPYTHFCETIYEFCEIINEMAVNKI